MEYKVLNRQLYVNGKYSIVPIRAEDRYAIMKWRNEQMYHLRQNEPLTKEKQDNYFDNTIATIFSQNQPGQILFSFLEGETCIGYGGLVHINWLDKNAEISFIMNTELERDFFEKYWGLYLKLIEHVAFADLMFHKLFTYAYDVRPKVISVLEKNGYVKEALLKDHKFFNDGFIDILIHSKINLTN